MKYPFNAYIGDKPVTQWSASVRQERFRARVRDEMTSTNLYLLRHSLDDHTDLSRELLASQDAVDSLGNIRSLVASGNDISHSLEQKTVYELVCVTTTTQGEKYSWAGKLFCGCRAFHGLISLDALKVLACANLGIAPSGAKKSAVRIRPRMAMSHKGPVLSAEFEFGSFSDGTPYGVEVAHTSMSRVYPPEREAQALIEMVQKI